MLIGVFNVVVSCSCSERGITCESCDVRVCCVRLRKRGGSEAEAEAWSKEEEEGEGEVRRRGKRRGE